MFYILISISCLFLHNNQSFYAFSSIANTLFWFKQLLLLIKYFLLIRVICVMVD